MEQQTIKCAFCKGTGENPHFRGTCPVCKGKKENLVTGKYMACNDCRSFGRKRGTSLTCYTCAGLGVIPDTREDLRQARQDIREIQKEMEEERAQFQKKQPEVGRKKSSRKRQLQEWVDDDLEGDLPMAAGTERTRFCQSCAKSTQDNELVKVCLACFKKIKEFVT